MKASNFRNIRFETELLESLDWDGGKLLQLYNYIEEATAVENPNSMHMLGIIKHVSENYSEFFLNGGLLGKGLGNYHNYFFDDFKYKTYILPFFIFLNFLFLFFLKIGSGSITIFLTDIINIIF